MNSWWNCSLAAKDAASSEAWSANTWHSWSDCVRPRRNAQLWRNQPSSRPTCVTWWSSPRWWGPWLVSTTERLSTKLKLSLKWFHTTWQSSQLPTSLWSTVGLVLVLPTALVLSHWSKIKGVKSYMWVFFLFFTLVLVENCFYCWLCKSLNTTCCLCAIEDQSVYRLWMSCLNGTLPIPYDNEDLYVVA